MLLRSSLAVDLSMKVFPLILVDRSDIGLAGMVTRLLDDTDDLSLTATWNQQFPLAQGWTPIMNDAANFLT